MVRYHGSLALHQMFGHDVKQACGFVPSPCARLFSVRLVWQSACVLCKR